MSRSDATADEPSASSRRLDDLSTEPQLFLILECDRLLAAGARSLAGISSAVICRGVDRSARRSAHGSDRELRVEVPSKSMSANHARLVRRSGQWAIEDLGSRNGTFLNGYPVDKGPLADGDILQLGRTIFRLRTDLPTPAGAPADLDASDLHDLEPGLATLLPLDGHRIATFRQIAASDVSVLLLGQTGTGKELLARALHSISRRKGKFIAVNCGALAPSLTESQLFGHLKGSFSGASRDSVGFVRAADGGTLFLDEIGDLAVPAQATLLRTVEESEVVPLGAAQPVKVDVRIVAATHKTIETDPEQNRFRSDLLARIAGYTHRLPPLVDRLEDLGLLISHLLRDMPGQGNRNVSIEPNAARALLMHRWPMNIRELKQALRTSTLLAQDGVIRTACLPATIAGALDGRPAGGAPGVERPLTDQQEQLKVLLIKHMRTNRGNVTAVSRQIGKASTQVYRWLKRFGVNVKDFR